MSHQRDQAPDDEVDQRNRELLAHLQHMREESDRGLVITMAAQVDCHLRRILESFLIDDSGVEALFEGPFAPFSSLSGKTKAAYLLGLITKSEAARIDATRRVRNVFAHEISASFDHPGVQKLCAKAPIFDGRLCDRDAFMHMAMNIIPALMYRDIKVRTEWKRTVLEDAHRR